MVCVASSYSATRCYSRCMSLTFTHSGSDNHTEPQFWNTSNLFEFTTNCIPSSSCPQRAKVRTLFSLCFGLWGLPFCFLWKNNSLQEILLDNISTSCLWGVTCEIVISWYLLSELLPSAFFWSVFQKQNVINATKQ